MVTSGMGGFIKCEAAEESKVLVDIERRVSDKLIPSSSVWLKALQLLDLRLEIF